MSAKEASTASQKSAKSTPPASETSETASTPVWSTGPEQVQVELLFGGEYSVDLDIATRMGIAQEGLKVESPITVTGCSARDFERALVFCANDRDAQQPPSKELCHIIAEMAPPSVTVPSVSPEPDSKQATPGISQRLADVNLNADEDDESDEEDYSYQPSSESEASDSGEEYSDTDMADVGTAAIKAEREEVREREKEKERRLTGHD